MVVYCYSTDLFLVFCLPSASSSFRTSKDLPEGLLAVDYLSKGVIRFDAGDEHLGHLFRVMLELELLLLLYLFHGGGLLHLIGTLDPVSEMLQSHSIGLIFDGRDCLLGAGVDLLLYAIRELILEGVEFLVHLHFQGLHVHQFGSEAKGPWLSHRRLLVILSLPPMRWGGIFRLERLQHPEENSTADRVLRECLEKPPVEFPQKLAEQVLPIFPVHPLQHLLVESIMRTAKTIFLPA